MWRLPIQSHLKQSNTEKRRIKAKYLTLTSIRLRFVKNTSMPNLVKSLGNIKCYSSSSPRPVKSPSISTRYNCLKICNWFRRPKNILAITKKTTFLLVINNCIIYKFFKDVTNCRKKRLTGFKFLDVNLSPQFLNTVTINENFQ